MSCELSFYSGDAAITFKTAIISGVCRSGKSLLGNLVATFRHVEHSDEPWLPMVLPMMAGNEMIAASLARRMFRASVVELFNDLVLLRNANFRPADISNVWKQKEYTELFYRLTGLRTRTDVHNYIQQNDSLLVLNLAETSPFSQLLSDWLPETRLIHVVRNGAHVAAEVHAKGWLSNQQLRLPRNAQIYRPYSSLGSNWYLPWWVDQGDEDWFVGLSDFDRGLYYWASLVSKCLPTIDLLEASDRGITVQYEQLVVRPATELERVASFLERELTPLSYERLHDVWHETEPRAVGVGNDQRLAGRVAALLKRLGYSSDADLIRSKAALETLDCPSKNDKPLPITK